jgi:hypothetical protein
MQLGLKFEYIEWNSNLFEIQLDQKFKHNEWNSSHWISIQLKRKEMQIGAQGIENMFVASICISRDYDVEIFQFKTNSKPKPILVGQDN